MKKSINDNLHTKFDVPFSLTMRYKNIEAFILFLSSPSIIIEDVNSQSIYRKVLSTSRNFESIDKIMNCKYFYARLGCFFFSLGFYF